MNRICVYQNKVHITRFLLVLLFVCSSIYFNAQITGSVILNGQTNHSGIKVKFIPFSPTATLDSVFTNAAGNYTSTTTGGVYKIEFSKSGYQTHFYNNYSNITLNATSTLSNVILFSGNLVTVNGNVSGTWSNANTYLVTGNITIPLGDSLKILPGTMIKFSGNYSLTANGKLTAVGDSMNRIFFTSYFSSPTRDDWNQIALYHTDCVMSYCVVEYCSEAIRIYKGNPKIINNEVRYFNYWGIYSEGFSNASITHNTVHDYNIIGIQTGSSGTTTVIDCNKVYNGNYGIRPYAICQTRNNEVFSCSTGIESVWQNPTISNNIVYNCFIGIYVGSNITPVPTPTIIGNTVFSNTIGVRFIGNHASGVVINNVIANNIRGISQYTSSCGICNTTPSVVANNLFWNNTSGDIENVPIIGLGTIVSTNSNGDPVDSYFNLFQDPLFTSAPLLNSNSPCYNAGNTTYSSLIGYDASKSCSAEAAVNINKLTFNKRSFVLYPNPAYNLIQIQSEIPLDNIEVIGVDGTLILKYQNLKEYSLKYTIDIDRLKPGMYIIKISNANEHHLQKFIKY